VVLTIGEVMSETYFVKKSHKDKFTILDNTCIQDSTLSWKSKGVHTYLMSLPEDWKIFISEIVNHSSDGKSALYSAIQELEKHGYVKKIQNRRDDGCFGNTVYYVFEKPESTETCSPLTDFPHADYPDTVKPDTDNRTQLTTNKLNTNKQNTKLTNYEQSVSESVFITAIKELFDGEYLFDNQFESAVHKKLKERGIGLDNLEAYLNYVFERTKLANPIKSFEGLYRKLALSNSILQDFKLGEHCKQKDDTDFSNPYERKYECPICHSVFSEYDYYCPSCSLSVDAIKKNDLQEIKIKTKLHQMTEDEKSELEVNYQTVVKQKGRNFLTPEEKVQFYKDYEILN
jgi:hypothetical protein